MIKTILLVDPDPRSIGPIRKIVGRAGFRVQLALDGRSGVLEFERLRPDLTLIQDVLPVMDGLEACRRMKAVHAAAERPVAIVTAPRSHEQLLETGCDAYIVKPFADGELLDLVRELLNRADDLSTKETIDLPADGVGELPILFDLTEHDLEEHLARVLVDSRRSLVPVG
jgi:DNA-binding response OmpR family regulator